MRRRAAAGSSDHDPQPTPCWFDDLSGFPNLAANRIFCRTPSVDIEFVNGPVQEANFICSAARPGFDTLEIVLDVGN